MKNEIGKQWDGVHPLLRGGQPSPEHRFSKAQLDAITAISDTLFPSVTLDTVQNGHCDIGAAERAAKSSVDELDTFFSLSASDAGVPLEAAGQMTKLLKRSQALLINFSLWLFATRLGTLILGGRHAVSTKFPFIQNFASLSPIKKQLVMLSLSESSLSIWQELFRFLKCFICWIMFTKVDEYGRSPVFNAMKYRVADTAPECRDSNDDGEENITPLEKNLIDTGAVGDNLSSALQHLGCSVMDDLSRLRDLRRNLKELKGNYDDVDEDVGIRCDAVVLGSGSGGAVVAAALAQAGYKVVILEKGGYFAGTYLSLLEGPSMYAMYEESGCLVTDDSRMILLAGSTVGGGSTVNWSASFRTPQHVRREWAEEHNLDLFSSSEYDKAMDVVCARLGVQEEVENENFQNSVLRKGCKKLGYHVGNIPRNSQPDHYCGFCGLGCKTGSKQGATETWLGDAARNGAIIVTGCKADEVLHDESKQMGRKKRRAVGVVAKVGGGGGKRRLYVEAEIVVAACGALQTPPLLKRSGLRNGAIGKNLHIHPVQLVWGYFPAEEVAEVKGKSYEGGIMTAYSRECANWETSGYGAMLQCAASQPGIIAIGTPWRSGADFKARMQRFARTAFFITLTRDKGSGTVAEDEDGRLCVRYGVSGFDKESLRNGAEHGLRVLAAAGAAEIGTLNADGETFEPAEMGGDGVAGEAELEEFLQRARARSFQKLSTITVSAHQMGSCRMGVDPGTSATDPRGESWEVEGLFIGDSSVFPTASGVNPMITVQSIAYCTAQSILETLAQRRRH